MSTELLEKTDLDSELKKLIENIDKIKSDIDIFSVILENQLK